MDPANRRMRPLSSGVYRPRREHARRPTLGRCFTPLPPSPPHTLYTALPVSSTRHSPTRLLLSRSVSTISQSSANSLGITPSAAARFLNEKEESTRDGTCIKIRGSEGVQLKAACMVISAEEAREFGSRRHVCVPISLRSST